MDIWQVVVINKAGDQRITCPRCGNQFLTDETWPGGGGYIALPCSFCFKASRIPGGPALLYDSNQTAKLTLEQAEALVMVGEAEYSPMDGPNGLMYRPTKGKSVAEVMRYLA